MGPLVVVQKEAMSSEHTESAKVQLNFPNRTSSPRTDAKVADEEENMNTNDIEQLKRNQAKLIKALREQEIYTRKMLNEKDQRINELIMNQKSIDLDLHNLTEQLFEQAYKLVNEEKKRLAELKVRVEMLEAENSALKSTVKAHKRPTFSHRVLSPTSLMTPVKLSKTPFRRLLNRYANLNDYVNTGSRIEHQVTLMEPLLSEDEPSQSEKSLSEQHVQPSLSPSIKALIAEVNTDTNAETDVDQLKKNQNKLVNALTEQEQCNQKLRSYIDNILQRVIEIYPEILEISGPSKSSFMLPRQEHEASEGKSSTYPLAYLFELLRTSKNFIDQARNN